MISISGESYRMRERAAFFLPPTPPEPAKLAAEGRKRGRPRRVAPATST